MSVEKSLTDSTHLVAESRVLENLVVGSALPPETTPLPRRFCMSLGYFVLIPVLTVYIVHIAENVTTGIGASFLFNFVLQIVTLIMKMIMSLRTETADGSRNTTQSRKPIP